MQELNQPEVDKLAKTLDQDLLTMLELLSRSDPLPPEHVRIITSSILRKWLIESWISKLANATNSIVTFPVIDNSHVVETLKSNDDIRFFLTGGVRLDGKIHWGLYSSSSPIDGKPPIDMSSPRYVELRHGKFLKQPRLYFDGDWFSTEEIIKFVCNKDGGIHIELDLLSDKQRKLVRANTFMRLGNPDDVEEKKLIENTNWEIEELLIVLPRERGHTWTSTDVEMLSAAQSLINMRVNGEPYLPLTPDEFVDSPANRQEIIRKE